VLVYHSWLYSAPDGRRVELWPVTAVLPDLAFGVVLFFTLSGFLLYPHCPIVVEASRDDLSPVSPRVLAMRCV
jgi:hypothetical protein